MNTKIINRLIILFATIFVLFSFDHAQAQGGWFPCRAYNGKTICDWSEDPSEAIREIKKDYKIISKEVENSYENRIVIRKFESSSTTEGTRISITGKMRTVNEIITKLEFEIESNKRVAYRVVLKSYDKIFGKSSSKRSEESSVYFAPNTDETRTTVRVMSFEEGKRASVVVNRMGVEDLI
ncbi:hypothetical protein [Salinibacter ruber]|uniref:hypothetical protein n=1 Tax=Salinibacter ruber TaxID=146919 RepID=UPI0021696702|nr:hypothetical protein [Salinibacter ruber]MCS3685794.1 hypothetical protein [Salinibacter ruber]